MLEVLGAEEEGVKTTTVVVDVERSMLRDVLVAVLGGVGAGLTLMFIGRRRAR